MNETILETHLVQLAFSVSSKTSIVALFVNNAYGFKEKANNESSEL